MLVCNSTFNVYLEGKGGFLFCYLIGVVGTCVRLLLELILSSLGDGGIKGPGATQTLLGRFG